MSEINLMKLMEEEEQKGGDDQLNTDQQSIDSINILHTLDKSMPKDKTDMLSSIIKGELLFYTNCTMFSSICRL